jgi:hypothetical protein
MSNWIRLKHSGDLIDLEGVFFVVEAVGGSLSLHYRAGDKITVLSLDAQQVKAAFDYKLDDDEWGPDDVATLPPEAVRQIVACRDRCECYPPTPTAIMPHELSEELAACEPGEATR